MRISAAPILILSPRAALVEWFRRYHIEVEVARLRTCSGDCAIGVAKGEEGGSWPKGTSRAIHLPSYTLFHQDISGN